MSCRMANINEGYTYIDLPYIKMIQECEMVENPTPSLAKMQQLFYTYEVFVQICENDLHAREKTLVEETKAKLKELSNKYPNLLKSTVEQTAHKTKVGKKSKDGRDPIQNPIHSGSLKQEHDQRHTMARKERQTKVVISIKKPSPEKVKLVVFAVLEIWKACELGQGSKDLTKLPAPFPSKDFLQSHGQHLSLSYKYKHDYLKHVFSLTWEIVQKVYPKPELQSAQCLTEMNKFKDKIIKQILRQCGLQNKRESQEISECLLDEQQYLVQRVSEEVYQNLMRKSAESLKGLLKI